MTMPTDAAGAVPSEGGNDGPRPSSSDPHEQSDARHPDPEPGARVDEENVPHPGDADGR